MRNCERCHRKNLWRKTPDTQLIDGQRVRIWQCRCGHYQSEEPYQYPRVRPKILYFDVETALMEVLAFDLYVPSKRLSKESIIKGSYILCWAAGWVDLDSDEFQPVFSNAVRKNESLVCDDRRILVELWSAMSDADYIVGHNSSAFDIKKVNWRFIKHNMGLPFESKQVDTLKLSRKYASPESHALDYLSQQTGGDSKDAMTLDDWKEIALTGSSERLLKMEMYCRKDVRNGIMLLKNFVRQIEVSGRKVFK